jgi:ubiquitin-like domain-containing CTD phosphatase 1
MESLPDVFNDLDVDFSEDPTAAARYKNDQRNVRAVKDATRKLQVNIIHPLRPGMKLLVLDIDYSELAAFRTIVCLSVLQQSWTQNL